MEQLFLTILNRAVTAGWLVLLVMVLRVVLKKAPRAAHYGLWAIVAVRLLWPGDLLPRAGVSLVPTTEPISGDVLTAAGTAASGGLPAVGSPAGAAAAETAARTGQSLGHIAAMVWLVGMAAMALYLAGSYVRLRVRLRTAVRLEDGVWESEQAPSPFVLGFIRPRIYLPFGGTINRAGRLIMPYVGIGVVIALAVLVVIFLRSEGHTSELQSRSDLVCRLLLEKNLGGA